MRVCDWSSDDASSDLDRLLLAAPVRGYAAQHQVTADEVDRACDGEVGGYGRRQVGADQRFQGRLHRRVAEHGVVAVGADGGCEVSEPAGLPVDLLRVSGGEAGEAREERQERGQEDAAERRAAPGPVAAVL